jgi:hypothetical protein
MYTHTHTRTQMCTHTPAPIHAHTSMCTDVYHCMYTNQYTYIHTYIQWLLAPLSETTLNNYHPTATQIQSLWAQAMIHSRSPPGAEMMPRVSITNPNQSLSSFCCSPKLRPQMQSILAKYEPEVKILSQGKSKRKPRASPRATHRRQLRVSIHRSLALYPAPPQLSPLMCPA